MVAHGKKYRALKTAVGDKPTSSVQDVFDTIKKHAYAKFDETIDVNVNLGIDPSKGDQGVRGSVTLPFGSGKSVKVLVFAKGDHAGQAAKAGADYVGAEDLIEKISQGWMDFDFAVATPDLMGKIGSLAKLLGPRGLLPNAKLGTVTFDVAAVVTELKKGKKFFRNDKSALVHMSIGKVSFDKQQLLQNLAAFVKALMSVKPASSKGVYLKKITLSSTMGAGFSVNPEEALKI